MFLSYQSVTDVCYPLDFGSRKILSFSQNKKPPPESGSFLYMHRIKCNLYSLLFVVAITATEPRASPPEMIQTEERCLSSPSFDIQEALLDSLE